LIEVGGAVLIEVGDLSHCQIMNVTLDPDDA